MENKSYMNYFIGILAILVLPLLAIPPFIHPPPWGKATLFRIIFSVLLFLFIKQLLYKELSFSVIRQKLRDASLIIKLLMTLIGLYVLSTIFSIEPIYSLLASPQRGGGSLNYIFYIIFAILVFLIIKPKDWQKLWDFNFLIGILVSFITIAQKLGWFGEYLITYSGRTIGTMGGPSFLALYLILLIPMAFVFGVKNRNKKSIFYFLSVIIFFISLLFSATRASLLGLFVATLFFVFFYPVRDYKNKKEAQNYQTSNGVYPVRRFSRKNRIRITGAKVIIAVLVVLGLFTLSWMANQPELAEKIKENKAFGTTFTRIAPIVKDFSIYNIVPEGRVSAWKNDIKSLKDNPVLGYGPENHSIAFDKYYDPSMPGMTAIGAGGGDGWWDRAHNFILEIAVTVGIPALIVYLLIIGVLFWQLQKLKKIYDPIIYHGIQATLIGYLIANLFGFDSFSTYLLFFFLLAYSLHLISQSKKHIISEEVPVKPNRTLFKIEKYKGIIMFVLLIVLIWFIWFINIKPLKLNSEINRADHYIKVEVPDCPAAVVKMEEVLKSPGILANYAMLKYIDIIGECANIHIDQKMQFVQRAIGILDEVKEIRPTYTRTWVFLGIYINIYVENSDEMEPIVREEWLTKADQAFQTAYELSPGRQKTFMGWVKTDLLRKDYQQAKIRSQECIDLDPQFPDCWWAMFLAETYLGNVENAFEVMEMAIKKGYDADSKKSFLQMLQAYIDSDQEKDDVYYNKLAYVYEKLLLYDPHNFQYYASLAFVYKELGNYDRARELGIFTFALSPESLPNVESFLKSLPYDDASYKRIEKYFRKELNEKLRAKGENKIVFVVRYRNALAMTYKMMGNYTKAREEAFLAIKDLESILWMNNVSQIIKSVEAFLVSLPQQYE